MKPALWRVLERVADLLVGNFTVSLQNELRFMADATGSACARGDASRRDPDAADRQAHGRNACTPVANQQQRDVS
ncbi:hypothetical protein PINS_up003571 [Pythium insidiosum]|nr:hypothetical protein PINS_up003571 [Pythium insidiosum]